MRMLVIRKLRGRNGKRFSAADAVMTLGVAMITFECCVMTWTSARLQYTAEHPNVQVLQPFGMTYADAVIQQKVGVNCRSKFSRSLAVSQKERKKAEV